MASFTIPSSEFGSSPPKLRGMNEDYPDPLRMHPIPSDFRPPVAKNFSFSVSGLWKSNGNLLRWITEVPSVHHDMTFEPATFVGEKHALVSPNSPPNTIIQVEYEKHHDDILNGHDGGEHCNKKVKRLSATGHQGPTAMRRRNRLVQSTRDAARRLSSSFQSILSSPRSHAGCDSLKNPSLGLPLGTPSTIKSRERLRFAVVGDSNCGKTCMLLRFYFSTFTWNHTPTRYELFNKSIDVDGNGADIELWDTSGQIELHQLALLSYLNWDGIYLCFSVNSDKQFTNAQTKWINEIHTHCRGTPVFLIGLKKDTRVGSGIWAPLFLNLETRVGASEGSMAANSIGAVKYMECSAQTGDGVNRIFEEGVRTVRNIRSGNEAMARDKSQNMGLGQLLCF